MTKLPTVCASVAGRPLHLYLASNGEAIAALVAQEDEGGKVGSKNRYIMSARHLEMLKRDT